MMTEFGIGTLASISLVGLALACFFYQWGGRDASPGKWLRRFVGSFILASTNVLTSILMGVFSWWFLLSYPLLVAGFSLGYGGDSTPEKVLRRSIYALGVCSAGLVYCFVLGGRAWLLLSLQVAVGLGSVWLGIKSILHASAEEVFICLLLNGIFMAYPFIR